jgi:hypothetical protein
VTAPAAIVVVVIVVVIAIVVIHPDIIEVVQATAAMVGDDAVDDPVRFDQGFGGASDLRVG